MPQRPVGQLLVLPIYASRSHPRARATTASCQGQKHLLLPQLERHQLRRGSAPLDDVRQFGLASADGWIPLGQAHERPAVAGAEMRRLATGSATPST
jgi:hypothetical protein